MCSWVPSRCPSVTVQLPTRYVVTRFLHGSQGSGYPVLRSVRCTRGGGGALECQGGYQARPKIYLIRVVFQDRAMYARTSFRVQNVQNWNCVFCHIDKFWNGHDRQIKKMHAKIRI